MSNLIDIAAQINGNIKENLKEAHEALEKVDSWLRMINATEKLAELDKAREIVDKLHQEALNEKASWL